MRLFKECDKNLLSKRYRPEQDVKSKDKPGLELSEYSHSSSKVTSGCKQKRYKFNEEQEEIIEELGNAPLTKKMLVKIAEEDEGVQESDKRPSKKLLEIIKNILKKRRQRGTKKRQKRESIDFEEQEERGVT